MSFAAALNSACQCIWLDRERLRGQLERSLGAADVLLKERPGLVAGSVVFVDPQDAAAMDRTTLLVHRALSSPAFARVVREQAPDVARLDLGNRGGVLGFDFHLGGDEPQLIEVNTNPGGLLVNLELANALTACCDLLSAPVSHMAAGSVPLEDLPARVIASFREEWQRLRGEATLGSIAIVDDDPANQYLHPEFTLFQRLFEREGWNALIADAGALEIGNGALWANGTAIDLVYNRVTDFYFNDERHAALRQAYENDLAVITPNPATHARWADKRLLAWLRDESLLLSAGLDELDRAHLLRTIPETTFVTPGAADDLWRRRKQLFFKPVDGFGSKAAYRGDKLTRKAFEHIVTHRYVAQAIAPTTTRRVIVEGEPSDLHVDVRNYAHDGAPWLRAARLYRGQTTNFRTPGGGFAPVLTLPGPDQAVDVRS
jgi:hypothetical protein